MFLLGSTLEKRVGDLEIADVTNGVMGQRQRFGQRDLETAARAGTGMPAVHDDFVEG